MKWWNDLWLNEGFATYVQRIVLDSVITRLLIYRSAKFRKHFHFDFYRQVSPKYQYGTLQCLDFLNILNTDALQSSHPISVEVKHPNQIKEIFDGVSYTKGSHCVPPNGRVKVQSN
jgi:aminopeptidase N